MTSGFARDFGLALIVAALFGLVSEPTEAAGRRGAQGYPIVVAYSIHGHGEIAGPVRGGPDGRLEVRLPGGTWLQCERSCSETLRRETIDFWEARNGRATADGAGYFRWSR